MELEATVVEEFEAVKGQLLDRLGQIPPIESQKYGGSMVELYPETETNEGGLYLMANGEFATKTLKHGFLKPATAENFVEIYLLDFDREVADEWVRSKKEWDDNLDPPSEEDPTYQDYLNDNPRPTIIGVARKTYSQEKIDSILREGIQMLKEGLTKDPYTKLGIGRFGNPRDILD